MKPNSASLRRPQRTLIGGKIVFNNKSSVFDCRVRALSDDGVVIQVPSTLGVPRTFELRIGISKTLRECTVAWRTETEISAVFADGGGVAIPQAAPLQHSDNVVAFSPRQPGTTPEQL